MRVLTWNVNGLRAALKKGVEAHLALINPDVVLLQEVRALVEQLPTDFALKKPWSAHWNPAQKLGWSGTATWSRLPLSLQSVGFDGTDADGRILITQVGDWDLLNIYLPSGSAGPEKQAAKEEWIARFLPWAQSFANSSRPALLCGDLNIAHTKNDVWSPSRAAKLSGFLPHERDWFTDFLATGWTDTLREHLGAQQGPYTWWSNLGRAKAEDRGWRIDYALVNAAGRSRVRNVSVNREAGIAVSDHAPVIVDVD